MTLLLAFIAFVFMAKGVKKLSDIFISVVFALIVAQIVYYALFALPFIILIWWLWKRNRKVKGEFDGTQN